MVVLDSDGLINEVGVFGKYQRKFFLLMSFPVFFAVMSSNCYIFTAGDTNYRCYIPECDRNETIFYQTWLPKAVPMESVLNFKVIPSQCYKFQSINSSSETCSFNNKTERCYSWVYENKEETILGEWDLGCDENQWKLTLIGTVNSAGFLITMPFCGFISDRYGRRKVFIVAIGLSVISGVIHSFSKSYLMFVIFEFIDMMVGDSIYETAFVLGLETVGPTERVLGVTLLNSFNGIGGILLSLLAWLTPGWRALLRYIYIPSAIFITYHWLLPESVKWLMANGRKEEAGKMLIKMANENGIELPKNYIHIFQPKININDSLLGKSTKIFLSDEVNQNENVEEAIEFKYEENEVSYKKALYQVMHSRVLMKRLMICCICWATYMFVFYGLSLNSVLLGSNKYSSYFYISLIELPAYVLTYFIIDRFGRKYSLSASFLFCAVCCFLNLISFVDDTKKLILFVIGKFGITVSCAVIYMYTSEMFPTNLRHSILGICSMVGGIATALAPQTPLLAQHMEILPILAFGSASLAAGILSLFLPETAGLKLPDTLEEAENIEKLQSEKTLPIAY